VIYMEQLHSFYSMLKNTKYFTYIQLHSLQTPYRPVQINHTHKSHYLMTQLRIKAWIISRDFIDLLWRVQFGHLKSRVFRFAVINWGLVDHIGDIIGNKVIIGVIIIDEKDSRLADDDVQIIKIIMTNFNILLWIRQK
jgi:hypothetical protein